MSVIYNESKLKNAYTFVYVIENKYYFVGRNICRECLDENAKKLFSDYQRELKEIKQLVGEDFFYSKKYTTAKEYYNFAISFITLKDYCMTIDVIDTIDEFISFEEKHENLLKEQFKDYWWGTYYEILYQIDRSNDSGEKR